MPAIAPNTTVYVKNLNTKVKKPELRRQLHALFSTYGALLDVVATRADGMRGQAFVVFKDLGSATAAMRGLDGFEFYDRPLAVEYARTQSRATLGAEAIFEHQLAQSEKRLKSAAKVTVSHAQADAKGLERKRARDEAGDPDSDQDAHENKALKVDGDSSLVCSDLPDDVTNDMLHVLFQQYPGLQNVKLSAGTAIITFETREQAAAAKDGLDGFRITPTKTISLDFA